MAKPPKTKRLDPYRNFKFALMMDGRIVMGMSKAGGLTRTTEVVHFREGSDPSTDHKIPGRASYEAITLESGITHDADFQRWASITQRTPAAIVDVRKDLALLVRNPKGSVVTRYDLYRCWVSEITMLPELDANASAVTIAKIRIETEGWERAV
jgi:phage tail-like protein